MKTSEIHIRDPFVLPFEGKYYMYGTRGKTTWGIANGFDVYTSDDLENWEGPIEIFRKTAEFWADRNYWAPEVHYYNGKFYLFASFKSESECRGTQILISNSPKGPFKLHSNGPVTPRDWECLDGTLYISKNGDPYIVFCHEWVQIKIGTICALKLTPDLKAPVGEPILLFRATDPAWAYKDKPTAVTDGPFLYRAQNGELLMIWSTFRDSYLQAVARSSDGEITGQWSHDSRLLFEKDGGHGMIFKTFDGKTMLTLHRPNNTPDERPVFFEIEDRDGRLSLK
jgi:beta-xylosidase